MTDPELEPLRYPVGRFRPELHIDDARRAIGCRYSLPGTPQTLSAPGVAGAGAGNATTRERPCGAMASGRIPQNVS